MTVTCIHACLVIRCGMPAGGILAEMTYAGDTLGSVATYTCVINTRYIAGDTVRTCLSDREWNGTVLQCEG